MGYKTRTIAITPNVRIKLEPDAQAVEAVVVTGMTKTGKRLFTGPSDQLVADDVKLSGMADISRGLEGRSAGVSVQNVSGTFGTAPKIRVRGATSIFGSSKPLWVVDGIIMEDVVDIDADALSSGDATTLISSAIAGRAVRARRLLLPRHRLDTRTPRVQPHGDAQGFVGENQQVGKHGILFIKTRPPGSAERSCFKLFHPPGGRSPS